MPPEEIRVASKLVQMPTTGPDSIHLVVPELVPREFSENADKIEKEFEGLIRLHDENQGWL